MNTRKNLARRLAGLLDLPPDVILDLPKLTLLGDSRLTLENHRGLIEYDPERIRLSTDHGEIRIEGRDLVLRSIIREEILLSGRIHAIVFVDWGGS